MPQIITPSVSLWYLWHYNTISHYKPSHLALQNHLELQYDRSLSMSLDYQALSISRVQPVKPFIITPDFIMRW